MQDRTKDTKQITGAPAEPSGNADIIDMPALLSEHAGTIFGDSIGATHPLTFPFITPYGNTYDERNISKSLTNNPTDPLTGQPLNDDQLVINRLYFILANIFFDFTHENRPPPLKEKLNLTELNKALSCPLSGEIFTDPVVAQDKLTYERHFLNAYLKSHENCLPSGEKQTLLLSQDQYVNRVVKNLYELAHVDKLIKDSVVYNQERHRKFGPHKRKVLDYIDERVDQPPYTGSYFGYPRLKKIEAAIGLFFSMNNPTRKESEIQSAAKQGHLGEIADPIIQLLEEEKTTNGLEENDNGLSRKTL